MYIGKKTWSIHVLGACLLRFHHAIYRPTGRRDPSQLISTRIQERRSPVQVLVRDNNVDQALKALKKKMQREGVFREMKLRRNYEKPSERKAREKSESVRRQRKVERKRKEREGF